MGKSIPVLKKIDFVFSRPQSFITTIVKPNSKTASKVYLPAKWEGKEVVVILR